MKKLISALVISILSGTNTYAFSVATWNAGGASVENAISRRDDLKELAAAFRAQNGELPDVLVVQEVTSYAAARVIADGLGYQDASIVTTDVGDDKEIWPFALEIAVITTRPIKDVETFQSIQTKFSKPVAFRQPFVEDQSTGKITKGKVSEIKVPSQISGVNNSKPSRGLLRVQLDGDIVIYGVHLKSSGMTACRAWQVASDAYALQNLAEEFLLDEHAAAIKAARDAIDAYGKSIPATGVPATVNETIESAKNREAAAGAIGMLASADLAANQSVFVAGDFNTPVNEKCKTGKDLAIDATPQIGCARQPVIDSCGAMDGFDDTFGILAEGLAGSPKFSILTTGIGSSYVSTGYVDSPIDNILVAGEAGTWSFDVTRIDGPKVDGKVFGSDHYAVLAKQVE